MQPSKEQSIRQKLGSILGLGASRAAPLPQKSYEELDRQERSIFFTADVLRELEQGVPVAQRVRAMKELHEIVATKHLEEHAVQAIWSAIKDLIAPSHPTEVRHATFVFTCALISGQFEYLGILRANFFRVVQEHPVKEDTQQRLEILRVLTQDGKDIEYMEEAIGPFLMQWMPEVVTLGRAVDFLSLLVNFVHYNAAYLDEEVLVGLVQLTCVLPNKATSPDVIQLCLELLNAVVCYSSLPPDALQPCVTTLCHTLNIERFSRRSLEVMLRLLGTHLGRSAIYTMCILIQERSSGQDALLLRGAVFYVSMSMWGVRRVESLDLTFASVLPSIKQAVMSGHTIVVYEVCLSLRRLIVKHSAQLHLLEWDMVYNIIDAVQRHIAQLQQATAEPVGMPSNSLLLCLQHLLTHIEEVYEEGGTIGTPEKFFALVENNVEAMPLRSVLTLVSYRTKMIDTTEQGWVQKLVGFMDKFYRREVRTAVRIEALNFLARVLAENSLLYEDELMQGVVLPLLQPVAGDPDSDVRCRAVQLLTHLVSEATPSWAVHSLAIISSVLQKGLELSAENKGDKYREDPKLPDSKVAVFGLTLAFKNKLHSSSSVAAQIFPLLVTLVQQQYEEECFLPTACIIRINIFNCVLSLRSNERGQLGYPGNDSACFSPFFVCFRPEGCEGLPSSLTPTVLDYRSAFAAVLACLKHECEWEVLVEVLHHLHGLLQDRTLTLASQPDLSPLCTQLCQMVDLQGARWKELRNVSSNWSKLDLYSLVYPVLANLCTYPGHLDRQAQHLLVCCLEEGLIGKSAQMCVSTLSISSLELQATMARLLPRVLYRLGQVSATPAMALPVLEFLSSLVLVPTLYSGFVEQQYLSVFGIALPYTNPRKYPPCIIAMAHRVVAQWFVRCRIQYRPAMARFISKKLSVYAGSTSEGGEEVGEELVEVCEDMMARFTYSNLSTLPSRTSGAEFLMSGGHSKTWLVGNSLVTVTTSGPGGGRDGICRRCAAIRASVQPDSLAEASLLHRDGERGGERGRERGRGRGGTMEGGGGGDGRPMLCSCWCRGWAEIKIRRPTGNISWLMRLQNRLVPLSAGYPLTTSDTGADWSLLAAHYPMEGREEPTTETPPDERGEQGNEGDDEEGMEERGGARCITEGGEVESERDPEALNSTEEPVVEPARGEPSLSLDDLPTPLASVQTSPTRHPHSKSEVRYASSYPSLSSLEHLPPLLSYDEGDGFGRSPSLHGSGGLLSEQEQLNLVASLSEGSLVATSCSSQDGSDTPTASGESESESEFSDEQQLYLLPSDQEPCSPLGDQEPRPPLGDQEPHTHPSDQEPCSPLGDQEPRPPLGDQEPRPPHSDQEPHTHPSDQEPCPPLGDQEPCPPLGDQEPRPPHSDQEPHTHPSDQEPRPPHSDQEPRPPHSDQEPHTHPSAQEPCPPLSDLQSHTLDSVNEQPFLSVVHSSPHPRPQQKRASLPEAGTSPPDLHNHAPSNLHPSPGLTRRLSTPIPPSHTPPSSSPAMDRKKRMFTQPSTSPSQMVGESEVYNNPSFIFLQLYHTTSLREGASGRLPLLLPGGEAVERAVKVLDHIPPYDTHKIGVVYVGQGQTQETEILGNTFGSSRYLDFLRGLGQLLWLPDCPPDLIYLGGLDRSGTDGQCTYFYQDEITQVVYHVATLMPTHTADPHCSNKKLHIGNDFVTVVYNDSTQPYSFGTIKGQFNFVEVVVEPLPGNMNRVSIAAKKGLEDMILRDACLISDTWLPVLVRQKALQANLASLVHVSASGSTDHALSNWLGRLHQLKRVREKVLSEAQGHRRTAPTPHFTAYS